MPYFKGKYCSELQFIKLKFENAKPQILKKKLEKAKEQTKIRKEAKEKKERWLKQKEKFRILKEEKEKRKKRRELEREKKKIKCPYCRKLFIPIKEGQIFHNRTCYLKFKNENRKIN